MRRLKLSLIASLIFLLPLQAFGLPLMSETTYEDFHFFGDHHNYMFASVVDFYDDQPDLWRDGVWLGTRLDMEPSLSWTHTLPAGLQVPPDIVTRAKLWIDGAFIGTDGNLVEIEGTWDWDPLNHIWFDNTSYDLSGVDQPGFWNMGGLDVAIWAGERRLRIDGAALMMDYATAAPEPASLLLVGLGLLGGLTYRKLRRQ